MKMLIILYIRRIILIWSTHKQLKHSVSLVFLLMMEEQTNELQQIIYQSSYIEKDYIHINNLYKGATKSPWGDFYYTNYTGNENEDPDPFNGVFLQYKDFLVVISWNENFPVGKSYSELFNDLDFEEISLK